MGRDLFINPYGRFYNLPQFLAQRGNDVHILLCSYKRDPAQNEIQDKDGIFWHSVSLLDGTPFKYFSKAKKLCQRIQPDWIIGFSDTFYGILAQHLASRFDSYSLIDAYDNYESYLSWCKPLHYLWRKTLAKADVVIAAGPQLASLMGKYRSSKPTYVVPMAVDPNGFSPLDKRQCRKKLKLPLEKKIIGYCGSIHPNRGLNVLFDAIKLITAKNNNIQFILSGRKDRHMHIPREAIWLGYLPENDVPILLNSMDVLIVINKTSQFGNFSYPIKLYEAMCCQVPVVATNTKSTSWILKDFPNFLSNSGDHIDFSNKILTALNYKKVDYGIQEGWGNQCLMFEKILSKTK